jgi:hypothetical protein
MTVASPSNPPYFSLFPHLKIKLRGRHFNTIEVIEAESQALPNTRREHDFQDAFKNGRSAGNGAYALKRTTSREMVASRPKVSFDQVVTPDGSLYYILWVFENRVLRRIFGPRRDEVMGGLKILHNEELHDLYASPNIIRIIKSRWMRVAGHVARVGK